MTVKRILKWTAGAIPLALLATFGVAYARSDNACGTPAPAPRTPTRAVVYCDYGPPDVLRIAQVEKPVPNDSQVLVRVRAAAVNPLDWHYMRGEPRVMRLGEGLRRPKNIRLGVDYAGTVEAVGRNVTGLEPGDEVFGARNGAFAEYVVVLADRNVVHKPANLTFEQAAAIPVSGLTALQALRDQGGVRRGHKVLINGASGGVGTFAVQIAKWLGADVTGVASTRNVALVRSLGADRVIDYTKEDFTRGAERYDVIVDNVGNHPLSSLRRVLKPEGRYVMVGGRSGRWIAPFPRVAAMVASRPFVSQDMRFFMSKLDKSDLTLLRDLAADGTLKPAVDRTYPLRDVREAVAYLETGRARAKVVVTME